MNIRPAERVDETFLWRIHYKYSARVRRSRNSPIFENRCLQRHIAFDPALVAGLLSDYFQPVRLRCEAGSSERHLRRESHEESVQPLRPEEQGQDLIEYALLADLISLASLAAITTLGTAIQGKFTAVGAQVTAADL
jgi:pilus assembly protein Flp/PilA